MHRTVLSVVLLGQSEHVKESCERPLCFEMEFPAINNLPSVLLLLHEKPGRSWGQGQGIGKPYLPLRAQS